MPPEQILLIGVVAVLAVVLILRGTVHRVTVYDYQRGLRYRNGQLAEIVPPGRYWLYGSSTQIVAVDMRSEATTIPGQEVLTSDGIGVKLSLAVTTRLADPKVAFTEIADHRAATYSALQVALREVCAALNIDEVLAQRDEIGRAVLERSTDKVRALGVELISVDVKDMMFPGPLKKLFAHVVEARQQGLATLEKARGETAALRSLANAARMVDASPALLQLRILQQLQGASGTTLVVGMPQNTTPLPLRTAEAGELAAGDAPAQDIGSD